MQDTQPAEAGDMCTDNCPRVVLHFRRELMVESYVMTSFGENGGLVTSREARVQRIDSTAPTLRSEDNGHYATITLPAFSNYRHGYIRSCF